MLWKGFSRFLSSPGLLPVFDLGFAVLLAFFLLVGYGIIRTEIRCVSSRRWFMPTQEERLSALEQTVAAFSRDIRDISHNETILLGMAMKQQEQTREIRSSLASLSEHLDTFSEHLGTFEQSVNSRFGVLETTLNEHTAVLAQILARLPEKP